MKDDLTKYGTQPIEQLSNAIVLQAVEDLRDGLVEKYIAEEKLRAADAMITDCKTFFASDWYMQLTSVEAQRLIDVAEKQAQFKLWQTKHGCRGCKRYGCSLKQESAWIDFQRGNRNCLKVKEKKGKAAKDKEGEM